MFVCASCRLGLRRAPRPPLPLQRNIATMLSRPSWSIRSLREPSSSSSSTGPPETITSKQLHHLLRLAALPLPRDAAEEATMLDTLQSQLQFVRAVQRVDTAGVEPLRAIRDETQDGVRANTITLEDLRPVLDREELVGHYKRPRRIMDSADEGDEPAERWHVLGAASRRAGKYFVVESSKQAPE